MAKALNSPSAEDTSLARTLSTLPALCGSFEKGEAMKVFLKLRGEDRYLTASGQWTSNPLEAQDYKSYLKVLDYQREHQLANIEALYSFEDPHYDFILLVP